MHKSLLLAVATLAAWPLLAVEGDFHWTGRLNPGQSVEIKGVNGAIRAEYSASNEIQVDGIKTARRSDPDSVRVEVVPHPEGITICSVYPDDGRKPNECRPGNEGRMSTRNNDVKVTFTVRVPKGIRLIAKTVNGEVSATGLQSDVEAHTVNGKIRVDTTELVRANTVNGGIEVRMGAGSWNEDLKFTTVNGGVDLTLPSGVSADVHATTVNGGISTDFPITVSGRWGPKSLNGRIGSGGRNLKISTVNGGIALRSSSGRAI
jgi:hypothetical protein